MNIQQRQLKRNLYQNKSSGNWNLVIAGFALALVAFVLIALPALIG